MARQVGVSVTNNFSGGLITEATPLNFPENACADTFNCIFNQDGSVERRPGIDMESAYLTKTIDRSQAVTSTFLWKNVAGDGNLSLLVVQVGNDLYFYDVRSPDRISSGAIVDTIDLTDFSPANAPEPKTNECQFAVGKGYLLVVHPNLEAFVVDYDGGSFTTTQIDLSFRDVTGVDDALGVTDRPTAGMGAITAAHHYNLLNQGWNATNLAAWDTAFTDLPSNADVMWQFKNSSDAFDTTTVANTYRGNSPAPKGHFILNVYDQQRDTVSGVSGIADVDTGFERASTVAFFAGRAFYAGVSSGSFNTNIYFSQIVEADNLEQFGNCYQTNDPTSEDAFDLLPTDGGVIVIHEAGNIFKLISIQGNLLVFASNGVWAITGSTGVGFTASDYTVSKLSSVRTLSAASFVDINGYPAWWNADGIYFCAPGETGSSLKIQSLTDSKIKTFFQNIPLTSRLFCHGAYDSVSGEVRWAYKSIEGATLKDRYNFDRILVFNTLTGAFSPWTVDITNVSINALFVVEGAGGNVIQETVVVGADTVQVDAEDVIVFEVVGGTITPKFKYLVSYMDGADEKITFAENNNTNYMDWEEIEASDFDSTFVSGYRTRGNGISKSQLNYLYLFSDNTENTQFYVQGRWNFANSGNVGKWSSKQLINNDDTGFGTSYRRIKVRGHGLSMQIAVQSVTGEPFHIIGWSAFETVNQLP